MRADFFMSASSSQISPGGNADHPVWSYG